MSDQTSTRGQIRRSSGIYLLFLIGGYFSLLFFFGAVRYLIVDSGWTVGTGIIVGICGVSSLLLCYLHIRSVSCSPSNGSIALLVVFSGFSLLITGQHTGSLLGLWSPDNPMIGWDDVLMYMAVTFTTLVWAFVTRSVAQRRQTK